MSKITNDGLTRSSTGCFIVVPIWQQWASKGYVAREIDRFAPSVGHAALLLDDRLFALRIRSMTR